MGMNEMNIIVSSAGKRVELIQLLRKTMESMHIKGSIIALDTDRTAPALYSADRHHIISRCDSGSFIKEINHIAKEEKASLLIPTIDTELPYLSAQRESIEADTGMKVMVSDEPIIDIFFDKRKTNQFFNDMKVPAPKIFESIDEITLPVIVKPVKGSAARGIKVIESNEHIKGLTLNDDIIVQELIEGIEITVDAFFDFNGNLVSVGMRERLRVRDGEVQIGRTVFYEKIYSYLMQIAAYNGFRGGVTFQAFVIEDNIYFIECNPRFGGGLPFTIMAGNNFLLYLLQIIQNGEVDPKTVKQSQTGIIFSRYDQSVRIDD